MFTKRVAMTLAIAALLTASASAQGFRDAGAKMRGEFGGANNRGMSRSGGGYRYSPPVIVQRSTTPPAVAQAPTQRRSFSVEPSQQPPAAAPCHPSTPAPQQAQRPNTRRSFSVEPSTPAYAAPAPSYRAPARRSSPPSYLLPKTDPRRYGNR